MKNPTRHAPLLLAAALSSACGDSAKAPAEDVGTMHQNWWIVGEGGLHVAPLRDWLLIVSDGYSHPNQVREALDFLKKDVRDRLGLAAGRVDLNPETVEDSKYHFDNCRFQESTQLLREHYDVIVRTLNEQAGAYNETSTAWATAIQRLGFVFHAVEDFYAHSNWIESGQTGLIDDGTGPWKELTPWSEVGMPGRPMRVVQSANNDLPAGYGGGTLDAANHRLYLNYGSTVREGLMTGRHPNKDDNGGSDCVTTPQLSMKHGKTLECEYEDVERACKARNIECEDPAKATDYRVTRERINSALAVCGEIWRSTYLAKDHPTSVPGRSPVADVEQRKDWRDRAHTRALEQTEHEFCRLVSLMDTAYPGDPLATPPRKSGGQRLYDAWVADPAAADAACKRAPSAFEPATDAWGANVRGSRLNAVDFNGDYYPDLIVREASDQESNFSTGQQRVWLLRNDRNGRFTDVTESSGFLRGQVRGKNGAVRSAHASPVVAFGDIDNDGDLDAFAGTPTYQPSGLTGTERSQLLLNSGGVFKDSGLLASFDLVPNGITFFDYDRDGALDLFVPARARRTGNLSGWLLRNDRAGTGSFRDISSAAGVGGPVRFPRASTVCDLNGDGFSELLVSGIERGANGLWQGSSGAFREVGEDSKFAYDANQDWRDNRRAQAFCSYVKQGRVAHKYLQSAECQALPGGCPPECTSFPCDVLQTATDADRDVCTGVGDYPPRLAKSQFGDAVAFRRGVDTVATRLGGNTLATLCADFSGDGKLDLFNAERRSQADGESADPSQILRNDGGTGDVAFTRLSPASTNLQLFPSGVDWVEDVRNAETIDFDNDGRPDLLLGGPRGRLFRNASTAHDAVRFVPIAVPGFGRSQGMAVADFDRDGDLDFVSGDVRGVTLFRNKAPVNDAWVQLRLLGTGLGGSNRAAIGARVTVQLDDGRVLVQQVDGGHGPSGNQTDLVLHFGLAGQTTPVHVTVYWPTKREDSKDEFDLAPGKVYLYEEGTPDPLEVALP